MNLPDYILNILNDDICVQLATSSVDGVPNVCHMGAKYLIDNDKLAIVDNYMNKTLENIRNNPNVAVLLKKDKESYQIKGKASYYTNGAEYDNAYKWMKSKGDKYPAKGVVIITFDSVYNSIPGENAGKKIQ